MPTPDVLFGADLRLLRDLNRHNSRGPGNDLLTRGVAGAGEDLATWTGVDNLRQALFLRFLTPLGALTNLGHPDYGSRLFELIGKLNNQTNRDLAKLYVLLALSEEPRVKEAVSVDATQNSTRREQIDINVQLVPIDTTTILNLVFPFSLAGGAGP